MYDTIFSEWADQTNFDKIIENASRESDAYEKINLGFKKLLEDSEPIEIQTIIDFLQNGKEDKSYRESVLYFIITAITNSNQIMESTDQTELWIQDITNLASLFGFSNDHCYLLSLIYTLERELKNKFLNLFSRLNKDIYSHIIRDKDLLPSDSQDNENNNELIYYIMDLLVKLKKYRDAYRFYNAFISENVQNTAVQVNIIKTLIAETSLITSFYFFKKSGKDDLKEKLTTMIEMTVIKKQINEFIHLPFDSDEIEIIRQILKDKSNKIDKIEEEEEEKEEDKDEKEEEGKKDEEALCYRIFSTLLDKVHL